MASASSISNDVWEEKKKSIVQLYVVEDWTLKQVIRRMRSDDFNPREPQLRSRLKKWGIRKPSRQAKKKNLRSARTEHNPAERKSQPSASPPISSATEWISNFSTKDQIQDIHSFAALGHSDYLCYTSLGYSDGYAYPAPSYSIHPRFYFPQFGATTAPAETVLPPRSIAGMATLDSSFLGESTPPDVFVHYYAHSGLDSRLP